MNVRCCGNCKYGHFGKCLNGKCVADRYSDFIPANLYVEKMLKKEIRDNEEAINCFMLLLTQIKNICTFLK